MPDETRLSKACIFDLLSNSRRRMVLFYLREHGSEITPTELAEEVAAIENDVETADLTHKQRKRVYVSLHQTHLPRLADAGIIEYDRDDGIVRLTEDADVIDSYLTFPREPEYPWHKHYISLAILSGIVLLSEFLGLPVIDTIPIFVIGAAITLTFGTSAVVQFLLGRRRREQLPLELCEDSF